MPNSSLLDLPTLDAGSVTNASSLFFFVSNNNNARLFSAHNLGPYVGVSTSTLLHKTAVQTISANSNTSVVWEAAERDPYGIWDAASNTLVKMNFNGWVQFRYRLESATGGGTQAITRVSCGTGAEGNWAGMGYSAWRDQITGYRDTVMTAPTSVVVDQMFNLSCQYQAINQIAGNAMRVWWEIRPLRIYN